MILLAHEPSRGFCVSSAFVRRAHCCRRQPRAHRRFRGLGPLSAATLTSTKMPLVSLTTRSSQAGGPGGSTAGSSVGGSSEGAPATGGDASPSVPGAPSVSAFAPPLPEATWLDPPRSLSVPPSPPACAPPVLDPPGS